MSAQARSRKYKRRSHPGRWIALAVLFILLCVGAAGAAAVGWVYKTAALRAAALLAQAEEPGRATRRSSPPTARRASASSRTTTSSRPSPRPTSRRSSSDATVAIEDERFYKHKGVDYEGIIRAAIKNAKEHKVAQGGSTLTMQLVRNLYTGDTTRSGIDGYKRKIKEARLAQELEKIHDKQWVLGKYLNTVPYGTVGGQTAIGAGAAARLYFNKSVTKLTLGEAAMLAGMPQAPSDYSPVLNPSGTKQRRNEVLGKMAELGMISQATAAKRDGQGPQAAHEGLLRQGARALRARLRQDRALQGVRQGDRAARRLQGLHDDQPQVPAVGARRR